MNRDCENKLFLMFGIDKCGNVTFRLAISNAIYSTG